MIGWVSAVLEPVTMKDVVVDHLGGGVAHRRGAERHLQRDHRAGMAQARAVIDVVGAEQRAEKLLQQVVVFVGRLGAAVDRHGVGAIALVNLDQAVGGVIERLVPGDLAPLDRDRRPACARRAPAAVLRISGVVTRSLL